MHQGDKHVDILKVTKLRAVKTIQQVREKFAEIPFTQQLAHAWHACNSTENDQKPMHR